MMAWKENIFLTDKKGVYPDKESISVTKLAFPSIESVHLQTNYEIFKP